MPNGYGQTLSFVVKGFPTLQAYKDAGIANKMFIYSFYKATSTATDTATFGGSWKTATRPSTGADPATTPGTQYNNAVGGIIFPNITRKKFIDKILIRCVSNTAVASPHLMDRLVAVGGISVASTGDKTINSLPLLRYTNGEAVMVYAEVTTQTATTAVVLSMSSYTNQDGTPGRVGGSLTFPATATQVGNLIGPFPLQAGDTGVRSVETVNVSTAASAGVTNILLTKTIYMLGIDLSYQTEYIAPLPYIDIERVYDGATLMWALLGMSGSEDIEGLIRVRFE